MLCIKIYIKYSFEMYKKVKEKHVHLRKLIIRNNNNRYTYGSHKARSTLPVAFQTIVIESSN